MHAINDNIYIKEVKLINQSQGREDKFDNTCVIDLKEALPFKIIDILQLEKKEYTAVCNDLLNLNKILLPDLKIETRGNKSLTFVGKVTIKNNGTDSINIPKEGWSVRLRYNRRVYKKKIKNSLF